ncbi:MAG TPA: hypothetical protein VGQ33_03360, partial [Vicinamibacteria bacterium]|nr:hypothetical protein [Vicinamibacteria bacterium]
MRASAPIACLLLLAAGGAAAAAEPPGHEGVLGPYALDREASGTSWQPEASGMAGLHLRWGAWRLMLHADVFGVFTHQGGPRGGDQAFSTNMAMAAGTRGLLGGAFTLRAMGSLEPFLG